MDSLLRLDFPPGVEILAYADDALLLIQGNSRSELERLGNQALTLTSTWGSSMKLRFAEHKTEALMLKGKFHVRRPPRLLLGSAKIRFTESHVHLGVKLEAGLRFRGHLQYIADKARSAFFSLRHLARVSWGLDYRTTRILYRAVFESVVCYAAPVWFSVLQNRRQRQLLLSVQRTALIMVTKAYRTVSGHALPVIAGVLPIDLLVRQRALEYRHKRDVEPYIGGKKQIRADIIELWQTEWDNAPSGRQTHFFWPRVQHRMSQKFVTTSYHLTQLLTGHGHFQQFLYSRCLSGDSSCPDCGEPDSAVHAVFQCQVVADDMVLLRQRAATLGVMLGSDWSLLVTKAASFKLLIDHAREVLQARELLHPYYH